VVLTTSLPSAANALPGLTAQGYVNHPLHQEHQRWVEKNCYIDLWIELLHGLKLEPLAMLPFVVSVDFEGDQWTFFKPKHEELHALYGLDVQELIVYRPLVEHALEHLSSGKLIATEADSWWLPDTAGTDYRTNHVKTSIVLVNIDVQNERLGYFHSAGYHEMEGEDFRETFKIGKPHDPTALPLFAEFVRPDRMARRSGSELARMSRGLLREHLARRPVTNPVARFAERFARELPLMQGQGLAAYHAWAFATLRQLGSAQELLLENLKWMQREGIEGVPGEAIESFDLITNHAKALILKVARAVNSRKPYDGSQVFGEMTEAWDRGMKALAAWV